MQLMILQNVGWMDGARSGARHHLRPECKTDPGNQFHQNLRSLSRTCTVLLAKMNDFVVKG